MAPRCGAGRARRARRASGRKCHDSRRACGERGATRTGRRRRGQGGRGALRRGSAARSRGGAAGDPSLHAPPAAVGLPAAQREGFPHSPAALPGRPAPGSAAPGRLSALRGDPSRAPHVPGGPAARGPVPRPSVPPGGVSGRDEWPAACRAVRNGDVCRRPGRGPHRRMMDAATPPLPPPTDPSCAPRAPPGLRAAAPAVPAAFLCPQPDGIP